ncbi:hypothetical protein GCM10025759_26270 [Lysobacter panacisoli]|uniref:Uncharacterized protein n=1 Tax=Lysobacter panacisoli TaxID=1255263 RepID=A0ABP9LM83_9GAMM
MSSAWADGIEAMNIRAASAAGAIVAKCESLPVACARRRAIEGEYSDSTFFHREMVRMKFRTCDAR